MRTAYFDCFAGISGDMTVGALIDLGVDPAALERELRKLPVEGFRIRVSRTTKQGVQATRFEVLLTGPGGEQLADGDVVELPVPAGADKPPGAIEPLHEPHRHAHGGGRHGDASAPHSHAGAAHSHASAAHSHAGAPHGGASAAHTHASAPDGHEHPERRLSDILALIDRSTLSAQVKDTASRIFMNLGRAEAAVHGIPVEEVHFHEVGGVDAIVDIVATAIGLEQLGVGQVYASPLHLGSGFVRCAHGVYPVPAPATANLLAGVPVYTSEALGELVTPTGAAIITTLAQGFGPLPQLRVQATGYGAGSRDRDFPNVLRIFLGEETAPALPDPGGTTRDPYPEQHQIPEGPAGYHEAAAVVIEASVDDMNPQLYQHLTERLLEAGALDVLLIPVQMKKGRPGTLLQVLVYPPSLDDLLHIIFTESTTIGVRTYPVTKRMLQRETRAVETPLGRVRLKVARLGGRVVNVAPEYEDCRQLARRHGLPLKEVYSRLPRIPSES